MDEASTGPGNRGLTTIVPSEGSVFPSKPFSQISLRFFRILDLETCNPNNVFPTTAAFVMRSENECHLLVDPCLLQLCSTHRDYYEKSVAMSSCLRGSKD